ncbi:MAG: ubiquinone biosynthesis protein UbiJ [Planctomycetota bacterium]|jgi:ubiquinone biosynthesis protein UbiJ
MRILGKIEQQLNHVLALDEDTLESLADLSGQVISLELINTGFIIYILPSKDGVHLQSEYIGNTNVKIRGTPSDMVAYLIKSNEKSSNFTGSIEVIGDVGLAQDFQSILKNIDLDWEEQLAHWFGDTVAHKLGRVLKGAAIFSSNTGNKIRQDVSEYLRFEAELTLDTTTLSEFSNAVDTLRNDVERLKLRIKRLERDLKVESE